ncbi:hypothetical protein [Paraburkholderia sp. J12]|uniref:hypothetical protein n=1 Tax=Paraburkholderia sp. J12 TaxID=2805432 RepID=UPI002ABD16DE|nr:hypothetical protein [Paraburkholderia sp. J12]
MNRSHRTSIGRSRRYRAQRGQALVEALVVAGSALIFAFLALNMIGHLSDARDRTLSASRYAAWERTVYFDDTSWSPTYGTAITKSDARIRSEVAQRVLGHDTKLTANDGSANALASTPEPEWRDVAGKDMLRQYNDLQVSSSSGGTGTIADKALGMLGSVSGVGLGFALPVNNQQTATVSLHMGYDNPTLTQLWPSWQGVTFADRNVLLTNTWTPDGSDKAKAMIADAVPTAKGSVIEYGLDGLAAFGVDITHLDLGRIEPDVVPQDRLGNR